MLLSEWKKKTGSLLQMKELAVHAFNSGVLNLFFEEKSEKADGNFCSASLACNKNKLHCGWKKSIKSNQWTTACVAEPRSAPQAGWAPLWPLLKIVRSGQSKENRMRPASCVGTWQWRLIQERRDGARRAAPGPFSESGFSYRRRRTVHRRTKETKGKNWRDVMEWSQRKSASMTRFCRCDQGTSNRKWFTVCFGGRIWYERQPRWVKILYGSEVSDGTFDARWKLFSGKAYQLKWKRHRGPAERPRRQTNVCIWAQNGFQDSRHPRLESLRVRSYHLE